MTEPQAPTACDPRQLDLEAQRLRAELAALRRHNEALHRELASTARAYNEAVDTLNQIRQLLR